MKTLQIGFKAFDAHELLCHFVASAAGLYERENLAVELVDITFMTDADLPSGLFQASCGAALSSALQGSQQRIVFVATVNPMFWIYGRKEIREIKELAGLAKSKVATFPPIAPPHHLANMVLTKAGLEVGGDVTLHPARDDVARLGLLKSGSVDAAVISSAVAPPRVEQLGFNTLAFIGDEIQLPTTGLAIDQPYLDKEPAVVQSLVKVLKEGLGLIHADPELVAAVLENIFDVNPDLSQRTAALYQGYYTRDGKASAQVAQSAIASLAKALSIAETPAWDDLYLF